MNPKPYIIANTILWSLMSLVGITEGGESIGALIIVLPLAIWGIVVWKNYKTNA